MARSTGSGGGRGEGRSGGGKRKKKIIRKDGQGGFDYLEISSFIGHYFSKGIKPGAIPALLNSAHNITIHPKSIWRWLTEIASKKGFTYNANEALNLRIQIKALYPFLLNVDVVATAMLETVAMSGAQFVFQLLREMVAGGKYNHGIHIGVAGGRILRSVMQSLSQEFIKAFTGDGAGLLSDVPTKLTLHALGAGFNIDDPTTDPNAMFTRFLFDPAIPVETKFVALHAPPIVHSDELEGLKKLDGICEAYERRNELDIVLTGLGTWKDTTGLLRCYMEKDPQSIKQLNDEFVLGDLCWRPVGENGPIETPTRIRAMTLLELHELAGLIERGGKVALFCGPGVGGLTKTEVLEVILANNQHLINYLIIDSRTARELVALPPRVRRQPGVVSGK
ncbi:MAG: hypothetical protein WD768_06175 [Phycisphaeraceae bacterium]